LGNILKQLFRKRRKPPYNRMKDMPVKESSKQPITPETRAKALEILRGRRGIVEIDKLLGWEGPAGQKSKPETEEPTSVLVW
jgi:hypothetical protein